MTETSSRVFHRTPGHDYPRAVAGDGPYIVDDEGKRYLDASGGAAVSCLGHSHPAVIRAIKDQLDRIPYAHTSFFTTEASETLAAHLVERAQERIGGGLGRVYFVSGGSEANETALKLIRQYFVSRGEPARSRFIARRQSYHGNTLGALAVGGNFLRRAPYKPLLIETSHIAPCYPYRDRQEGESEEDYGRRVADELETEILRLGPETVAAFVAETVVGATSGALAPVPGYFKRIREICDRHGVLLLLDEVMCGMGRTGTLFACEQDGIAPDLLTCAKGLGAGYQPIGAVLVAETIYRTVVETAGAFEHGFTYIGHATACAAALAVQRAIEGDGLLANVRIQGEALRGALEDRFAGHPNVGDIRGRGLFIGIELVADRTTKAPPDPALKLAPRIKAAAMARGLICYPGAGTIDGALGAHILLAPPFIIEGRHVAEIVDKLAGTLDDVLDGVTAATAKA
jgi:adenosylmethionine-8-amino-7-oxononanoate aminotransferase